MSDGVGNNQALMRCQIEHPRNPKNELCGVEEPCQERQRGPQSGLFQNSFSNYRIKDTDTELIYMTKNYTR